MTTSFSTKKAEYHLRKDPILAAVIDKTPPFERAWGSDFFTDLVESIISQQLSVKAADTIFNRLKKLFPHEKITAEIVSSLETEKLREVGISYQKISYMKDLAERTLVSGIVFEQFEMMSDEEIIAELVKVKGIGRWTAEMFLMFSMNRPDVFSYGDLGIRKAIQRLYGFTKEPTKEEAEKIAENWKPYRTLACRYLWRSLQNE